MLRLFICLMVAMSAVTTFAEVRTREVTYGTEEMPMKGYLAYDMAWKETRPGVLVVHEWWGHNDYAQRRARMLAEMGYAAMAIDMYGEGKTADHPDEAGAFAGEVMKNLDQAGERFAAAMNYLQAQPFTDAYKMAAVGYCFGGGIVLHMAREGAEYLDAVASFHGSLGTEKPTEKGKMTAAVLVCHGEDDEFTTAEQIDAFKKEMKEAGVALTFITYPGAEHSFTNPQADTYAKDLGLPVGYSQEADEKSWADLEKFLEGVFGE